MPRITTIDADSELFRQVVELADQNSKYLGFFPHEAFARSAREGYIVAAVSEPSPKVLGYILYFIGRSRAVIQHLCVANSERGGGIAKKLVEELCRRTPFCDGISLHCRRDFPAYGIWKHLGFLPVGEKPGRGQIPTVLTRFWRDHGHENLIAGAMRSRAAEKTLAVLDANVVYDLCDPKRPNAKTSQTIQADWLRDSIEPCVTDELFHEIDRQSDPDIRKTCRDVARGFVSLQPDKERLKLIEAELRRFLGEPQHERDASDLAHMAAAIASDATFFVTRERRLLDNAEEIERRWKLVVTSPVELIVRYDELRRHAEYQPVNLSGTNLCIGRMTAEDIGAVLERFLAQSTEERKGEWASLVRSALTEPLRFECLLVRSQAAELEAVIVLEYGQDSLEVRAFRVAPNALGGTLSRNLAAQIIRRAAARGLSITRMNDSAAGPAVEEALREFGFLEDSEHWSKVNLLGLANMEQHIASLRSLAIRTPSSEAIARKLMAMLPPADLISNPEIVKFERHVWPGKIETDNIPTFVVPIRAKWATELFDEHLANQRLYGADPLLALNTEHAYYRAAVPAVLTGPARIVWYVSEDDNFDGTETFRAVSSLDEVRIGSAKDLYKRFRRLGVFGWNDVLSTAHGDPNREIMAVVFSGTELFDKPIGRGVLSDMLKNIGKADPPLSTPYRLPAGIFAKLYRMGIPFVDKKMNG